MSRSRVTPTTPRTEREWRHSYDRSSQTTQRAHQPNLVGRLNAMKKVRDTWEDTHVRVNDWILEVHLNSATDPIVVRLPPAATLKNRRFLIKDTLGFASDLNSLIIDPAGDETIDGAATLVFTADYEKALIRSNGANWVTEA